MLTKERLHSGVELLSLTWQTAAIVHALIDLGIVTSLSCEYEDCDGTPFEIGTGFKTRPYGLTVDHIFGRECNRPEHFRIVHWICNMRAGVPEPHREAVSERRSAALKKRWVDDPSQFNSVRGDDHHTRRTPSATPSGDAHWTKKDGATTTMKKSWETRRTNGNASKNGWDTRRGSQS